MFYTKYRPQKFSEISQPNDVATALANQVRSKKVSHAYLFIGPRGVGKTTTARILAKALNCENLSKTGDPCDKCDACEAIKLGNFLDLIEIDAASNRGIDDIRDLKDKIRLAPSLGKQKVYIIDEVHMLTTEAFNALLKTLEEPPAHATFILCTTEEHKVPDTIKSRCQVFKFKRATVEQIVTKLTEICAKEKIKAKIKKEDLEKIARASLGGFRDAETLLQQVVEGELDIDSFVGVNSTQEFVTFVDSIFMKNTSAAIRQVNKLYEDGIDLHTWSLELLKYLRDLLFISADAHEGLVDVSNDVLADMKVQAAKLNSQKVVEMIEAFSKATNEIKLSSIAQLPLELAIVTLCEGGGLHEAPVKAGEPVGLAGGGGKTGGSKSGGMGRSGAGMVRISSSTLKISKAAKETKKSKSKLSVKFEDIQSAWQDVLKGVINHNHGVQALLKATKPIEISGSSLVIEVFYKFHKERLESVRNRQIVEDVLSEIFGEPISLQLKLSSERPQPKSKYETGELTDMNIKVASDISSSDSILDVFDGNLPL